MSDKHNLLRVLGNTGWLVAEQLLRLIFALVVGIWVARYLGPGQYGTLSYAIAFVSMFSGFAPLGLEGILVRDIVQDPTRTGELLGTAFVLRICSGLATSAMAIFTARLLRPDDTATQWLVIIIAASTVFQASDVLNVWFQAHLKSKYTVWSRTLALVAASLFRLVLLLLQAPLVAFAWAALAESLLGAVALALMYRSQDLGFRGWRIRPSRAFALLRISWPLALASVAILVYMRIDQLMIAQILDDRAVGIYSSAVRISEIWYLIPVALSSSLYPTIINSYSRSKELFTHRLKTIMGYFFWATLPVSIVIAHFSNEIILMLYGPNYAEAAPVLSIHIYSGVIVSMSVIFSQRFVIEGTTKLSLYGTIVGAASNILLNLWLIPAYGPFGAAVATLISYVVPLAFQTIVFDRTIGLTFVEAPLYVLRTRWA